MPDGRGGQSRPRRLKILLTEGSSTSARQALYCLGPTACDRYPRPQPAVPVPFFAFCPAVASLSFLFAGPEAYLQTVLDLIESEHYDVLFPAHEQVFLISRFRDLLRSRVGLAVPEFDALARMMSKGEFRPGLLRELELPQPDNESWYLQRGPAGSTVFPVLSNSTTARPGQGVRHVRDRKPNCCGRPTALRAAGWLDGQTRDHGPAAGPRPKRRWRRRGFSERSISRFALPARGGRSAVGGSSMAQLSAEPAGSRHKAIERLGRHPAVARSDGCRIISRTRRPANSNCWNAIRGSARR